MACLLLGSLVAGYLRDNASVDGISHKLRQLCPSLYRQEDATCSKVKIYILLPFILFDTLTFIRHKIMRIHAIFQANELLIFAKQQKNPAEREEMLQHALKLCKVRLLCMFLFPEFKASNNLLNLTNFNVCAIL